MSSAFLLQQLLIHTLPPQDSMVRVQLLYGQNVVSPWMLTTLFGDV